MGRPLICHAAKNYGVQAHGITLSERQLAYAQEKIRRLGLQDQVTVELKDYAYVEGTYDKVSSIGMVEHVGIDNMAGYMQKVASLMPDRGIFLNHGITRPGKMDDKAFRKMSAERKILAKYIFPGGELDHLGHMIQCMESKGFDVHDVEGWRDHYSLTCRHWCQRLEANREEAIRQVGEEKYRLWVLYLAGCVLCTWRWWREDLSNGRDQTQCKRPVRDAVHTRAFVRRRVAAQRENDTPIAGSLRHWAAPPIQLF